MPVTTDSVKAVLAGVLHQANGAGAVSAIWDAIIAQALGQATADVYSALAAQGLGPAEWNLWPGLDASVTSQALFWCLVLGAALLPTPTNSAELKELDQREKLPDLVLTDAAGNLLRPDPGSDVVGRGNITGGWEDVKAREPDRRQGFTDRGRFMRW
jgi:hypothetical protein